MTVTINSDRVHISHKGVPVETFLFSQFTERDMIEEAGRTIAIGVAVSKALKLNDGEVYVKDLSKKEG